MPFDTWGSHLENDIMEIDEYIQWVGSALNSWPFSTIEKEQKANEIGQKLLAELRRDKTSKEQQLKIHRQRDKESGLKY